MGKYSKPRKISVYADDGNVEKKIKHGQQIMTNLFGDYVTKLGNSTFPHSEQLERMKLLVDVSVNRGIDLGVLEHANLTDEELKSMKQPAKIITKYDFECRLTDKQIKRLLPVVNWYVFGDVQTVESMREWLECRNEKPVKVRDVGELCYFLNELRENGYICGNALTVAERNKTFMGGRGAVVTRKSLTAALTQKFGDGGMRTTNPVLNIEIHAAVEAIKKG